MVWVATAIIGGAVLGTVGSAISSSNAAGAATHAADVQAASANQAAQIQQQMYGQTRNDLAPFRQVGQGAIGFASSLVPGGLQLPVGGQTGQPGPPAGGNVTTDQSGNPVSFNPNWDQVSPGQSFGISPIEGGNAVTAGGQPGPQSQSPFLSGVQNALPGSGSPVQNALGSFVPGSSHDQSPAASPWDALTAAQNSVIGGSPNPNSALNNLTSFIPGANNQNPALGKLNDLLGLGSSDPAARQAALEATPGYQFTLDQGLKATQNGFAAQGLASSGAAMKGAATFATGLADSTYQQQLNNYLTTYNSQFNNAQNLYTNTSSNALNAYNQQGTLALNASGQNFANASNAYGQQLTNANNLLSLGENAAAQTGTIGTQYGANTGNYLTSGAAATAGGIVGSANALNAGITGGLNTIGNAGVNAALFSNNNSNPLGANYSGPNSALAQGSVFNPDTTGIFG